MSRTVDNVLVFGPPLDRGIERRSLSVYANPLEMAIQSAVACSEAKDGGLLGVLVADGVGPGFGCILQSSCERWLSFYYVAEF